MSNSPLVKVVKLSPHHSGQRNHTIDRISPHCVVGQMTAESLGNWFQQSAAKASSNYGIGKDGTIGMYVEEKNRSWCTSSGSNDNRAVTIECASDTFDPYRMNTEVYQSLILLCEDICRRNGKTKLLWFGDKEKTLNYQPKSDEMVITVHRWFAQKSCPGDWLYSRLGQVADIVTRRLNGEIVEEEDEEDMTQEKFNEMMNNWLEEQASSNKVASWSAEARQWAEKNKYIYGNEKGQKMYQKFMSREEFITVLYRIFNSEKK